MWLILLLIPADDLPNLLRPLPPTRTCNPPGLNFLFSNTSRLSQAQTGITIDCNEEKCYNLVSVDVEDIGAAPLAMQILSILWVDVDELCPLFLRR